MENANDLDIPKGKARSLISQFENQTPSSSKSAVAISEITSQINNIESLISTYATYNRKMHVSLHGKIIDILFSLNNDTGKYSALKLKEFHSSVKKLFEYLNDKLPSNEIFTPTSPKKSDNYNPFKYIRYSDHIKTKPKINTEDIKALEVVEETVVDAPKPPEIRVSHLAKEKPVSVSALRGFFESLAKNNSNLDNLAIKNYNPVMKSKSTTNLSNLAPVNKWPPVEFERSKSVSHLLDTENNNDEEERFVPRFSPSAYHSEEKSEELETYNVEENNTQSEESEEKFSDSGIGEKIDETDSKPSIYYSTQNIDNEDEEIVEETPSDNDFDEKEYEAVLASNHIENEEVLDDISEESNSVQEEIEEKLFNYDQIKNDYVNDARSLSDSDEDSLDNDILSQVDSLKQNNDTLKNKCTTF